jgi:hypothetical protein
MNFEDCESSRKREQIDKDHISALKAQRLGKSLVNKVLKMVDNGQTVKPIWPNLNYLLAGAGIGVDYQSTTMALNSELKQRGENIEAGLTPKTQGTSSDYSTKGFIEIRSIDGVSVTPDNYMGWS